MTRFRLSNARMASAVLLLTPLLGFAFHRSDSEPGCDPGNGGITLPAGFCATVFADRVGIARHMVVAPNGDLFVNLNSGSSASRVRHIAPERARGALLALRDTNADGHADLQYWNTNLGGSTGIALAAGWLYFTTPETVQRVRWSGSSLGVDGAPDTLVYGMPNQPGHGSKSIALDDSGYVFVGVGSASNACRASRTSTAPDPCPEMGVRSGIWRYRADRLRQHHPEDGIRWATGVRNAVAITWSRELRGLYALSHGRDGLYQNFPQYYSMQDGAEKPAEELFRVERGDDYGWPYCYYDPLQRRKVLAPEYGGNGTEVGRCAQAKDPLFGFPGHWAPNGILIYTGTQFPEKYRGGAFIAFHGSWNRMPLPEAGYNVTFVPFRNGRPSGPFEIFANGFAADSLEPILAKYRPMAFAQDRDGALYLSDDQEGRIWRIQYRPR